MKNLLLIVFMFFSLSGCSDKNEDWSSYGKDLTNQRYSKLQQINEKNVQNLSEDWSFRTGVKATFQATPIVQNGVMFENFGHHVAQHSFVGTHGTH